MGLFNNLFQSERKPGERTKLKKEIVKAAWGEYVKKLQRKREVMRAWNGLPTAKVLRMLLDNGMIDIEKDGALMDDLGTDEFLRTHARNIRTTERLWAALYEYDTRHDFLHGVLAHLHLVLVRQLQLVEAYINGEGRNAEFITDFSKLLTDETDIIATIEHWLKTFDVLFTALLNEDAKAEIAHREALLPHEQLEKAMRKAMYQAINGEENEEQQSQILASVKGTPFGSNIEADILEIVLYVKNRRGEIWEEGAAHDPQHPLYSEFHLLRGNDFDIWYINRADFIEEVQSLLSQLHESEVTYEQAKAFVTVYREWIHDYGAEIGKTIYHDNPVRV